jgi:hypothetical protein
LSLPVSKYDRQGYVGELFVQLWCKDPLTGSGP